MRPTLISLSAAILVMLGAGSGVALAQSRTVPDTSVKALEPPIDVKKKQLEDQSPPAANSGTSTPPARSPAVAVPAHQ